MATIPKKLAFKLYFREKTKTRKLKQRQDKLRQLSKRTNGGFFQLLSSKLGSKGLDKVTHFYLARKIALGSSVITNEEVQPVVKHPISVPFLLSQKKKLNEVFYSKQKQDVWLIKNNHVYFKTQMQSSSVSSKNLLFGLYGICSVQYATISAAYIETLKLDIAKILKKKGRVWTRVCCDCPVSARPAETRMGKGKGSISHWVAKVRPGQLLFEFSGITKTQVNQIFQKLCKKTSIGLSIIS